MASSGAAPHWNREVYENEQSPFLWYAGRAADEEIQLCPENLSTDIRLVLGILTACRRPTMQVIAAATAHSLEWVVQAVALLREHAEHRTIGMVLRHGLPLDAAVQFPEDKQGTVLCRDCNQSLASVPCANCSIKRSFSLISRPTRAKPQPNLPESTTPTLSLPGSAGKIAIMRLRAQQGLSVFCQGDVGLPSISLAG